jgi:hypothetical protein
MYLKDWRRREPRFGPIRSVLALLVEGSESGPILEGLRLARGVMVNVSESGARLVTNVGLPRGYLARLKLYSMKGTLLDTRARIVWSAEGVELPMDIIGTRQGIRFVSTSKRERVQIEQLLRLCGWQPSNSQMHFDVLQDPDFKKLIEE